ncbi:MAG: potassium transporter Kup [Desulfobulbus sp.]|nr:potassium transporter Kup [Desulfobulbus sp.]
MQPSVEQQSPHQSAPSLPAGMTLAALGVVYGDIGTSPLYAIRECFHGEYGLPVTTDNIFGVLSLVSWALILVVSCKYLGFVLRADNQGEGGVLALTALLRHSLSKVSRTSRWILGLGLFGACLLYGDGMITPAISVLSAVEGLRIITPTLQPFILPTTVVILVGIFSLQRSGTARIGSLFGPIMLLWFSLLAALGLLQIVQHPQILAALLPWHGLHFLLSNKLAGFVVLGAVLLVVTGAEALYADLGHFGKTPIRLAWSMVVFPALLLNYFGQGAVLLSRPEMSHHPFYALVPPWAMIPMVLLASVATVIASQAVISGAFSLTQQAIKLGYLPRFRILHTSASQIGQIYIAPVNWLLLLCTIILVVGFQSSSKIAAAYGVAVTATMLITTLLFSLLMRKKWQWPPVLVALITAVFLTVDLLFFGANIIKIFHGAWFPLVIGAFIFLVMMTWAEGNERLRTILLQRTPTIEQFLARIEQETPQRSKGVAVYLTRSHNVVPMALVHNLEHNKVLHSKVILLSILTEETPRVANFEKIESEQLGSGIVRIVAHYGFMEEPRIENIFALTHDQGVECDLAEASFFLGRQSLSVGDAPTMGRWRTNLFLFLSKNSTDVSSYFTIPKDKVIEIGLQLEL